MPRLPKHPAPNKVRRYWRAGAKSLTPQQIRFARALRKSGMTYVELGRALGVSKTTIRYALSDSGMGSALSSISAYSIHAPLPDTCPWEIPEAPPSDAWDDCPDEGEHGEPLFPEPRGSIDPYDPQYSPLDRILMGVPERPQGEVMLPPPLGPQEPSRPLYGATTAKSIAPLVRWRSTWDARQVLHRLGILDQRWGV